LYLVGSFNIQGFSALKRDMANDVLATWFNIFKEADIVCVQETADIAGFPKLQEGLNANKLLFEPRCMCANK
jgi:exonuclease III